MAAPSHRPGLGSRRRLAWVLGLGVIAVLAAIPVVAFAVVPRLVRSTLHESPPPLAAPPPAAAPTAETVPAPGTPAPAAEVVASGGLRHLDPVHFGTGTVSILRGATSVLRFQDVEINAAPQIYVYLSDHSDGSPGRFTDLGPLKATSGTFYYELPSSLDVTAPRSVVLWCRAFNVTITYAVLTKPT